MPRNRAEVPRDEKIELILGAAEVALRQHGWAGLSVAGLARDLGLAQNSIYWYFTDKDGLLVAVLEQASKRALGDLAALGRKGPVEQLIAAVDRMADMGPLEAAMRHRAPNSTVVRAFERTFDSSLRNLLRDVLRPVVSDAALDDIAEVFQLTATGALACGIPQTDRRRLLRRTLDALLRSDSH